MAETILLDGIYPMFGPTLYWPLDARNQANDISGNGRDGTGAGSIVLGGSGESPAGWAGSTDFTANNRINTSYNPFSGVTTFTGWAYRDASANADTLFAGDQATTQPNMRLGGGGNDVLFFPDDSATATTWTNAWPGNTQWVHYALIVALGSNSVTLYINGVLVSEQAESDNYGSTGNLVVGARATNTDPFDGKMAHFAVYDRALTSGEIGALFQRGAIGLYKRTEFDLTPWISSEGVDWGDAAMVSYMAEQAVGSSPVDYRIPNRQIRIPLSIRDVGGTAFATARSAIQSKIGRWQGVGGALKRTVSSGTVWCDIVNAQLHLSGDWMSANRDADRAAAITLEALPDFYEQEEALSDHTETTLPEITFTETTLNGGDFPLGDRVRIVVDEDQGQNQRGMFWAWRGRHYSSASTAASAYEAEALTTLDTATRVAKGGASGGTVVTHGTISTNWTPVLGSNIGTATWLTHTGTNRIRARVFSTSGTAVQARFVYDVGDLVNPVENDAVRLYDGGTFHILDLGEVRLDPTPTGPHRWQGMVQAKGDAGAESFSVDRVWIVNQDESAGVLQAPPSIVPGLSPFSARSEFTTESGAVTGDALAVGGNWTVVTNSDTTDYDVTGGVMTRTAVSDTGTGAEVFQGRGITAGSTNYAAIAASLDFKVSVTGVDTALGLVARVVDSSNYLYAVINTGVSVVHFYLNAVLSGVVVPLATVDIGQITAGSYYTMRLLVSPSGSCLTQLLPAGSNSPIAQLIASSSNLATGGTLASGRVGIVDYAVTASAITRTYDNFAAWVPTDDAVAFASQSVALNSNGITREDSGGTALGPVSTVYGDLPRMPNRASAGTVEFTSLMSRGDLQTLPDPGIDDSSARVYRRPSHLLIPN